MKLSFVNKPSEPNKTDPLTESPGKSRGSSPPASTVSSLPPPPGAREMGVDAQISSRQASGGPQLLLAVPNVSIQPDQIFSERNVGLDVPKLRSPSGRIELSPPEISVFQEGIRRLKLQLLGFVGGSIQWRLFLGCGAAVFIGAVTLMLLGPTPQAPSAFRPKPLKSDRTTKPAVSDSKVAPSVPQVQLTVSTNINQPGQEPAEFIDPFVPENQVQPTHLHAIYSAYQDNLSERSLIRQASRQRNVSPKPVRLTGTIEFNDDGVPTPVSNSRNRKSSVLDEH